MRQELWKYRETWDTENTRVTESARGTENAWDTEDDAGLHDENRLYKGAGNPSCLDFYHYRIHSSSRLHYSFARLTDALLHRQGTTAVVGARRGGKDGGPSVRVRRMGPTERSASIAVSVDKDGSG